MQNGVEPGENVRSLSAQIFIVFGWFLWTSSAPAEIKLLPESDYSYSLYRQSVTGEKQSDWRQSSVGVDSEIGAITIFDKRLNGKYSLESYAARNIDGNFDATRLGLRLKYKITDSFYISAGFAGRRNRYDFFDRSFIWGDMGPSVAIGNQWKLKGGYSFGVDWLRVYLPVVKFERNGSSKDAFKPDVCVFCVNLSYTF